LLTLATFEHQSKMTVHFSVTLLLRSQKRLVHFTHYLVFKDPSLPVRAKRDYSPIQANVNSTRGTKGTKGTNPGRRVENPLLEDCVLLPSRLVGYRHGSFAAKSQPRERRPLLIADL
jgi:hypothetical protein